MSVQLNHTIVACRDQRQSAAFLTEILGLPAATRFGRFLVVFDVIFGRIAARGIPYWADPGRTRPGEINHNDGGRGVYFADPDGHVMEIITRPYGG